MSPIRHWFCLLNFICLQSQSTLLCYVLFIHHYVCRIFQYRCRYQLFARYFAEQQYFILQINSSYLSGCQGCFQFGAVIIKTVTKILICALSGTQTLTSLRYILWSRITGSQGHVHITSLKMASFPKILPTVYTPSAICVNSVVSRPCQALLFQSF